MVKNAKALYKWAFENSNTSYMGFERVSLTNVGNLLAAAGAGAAIGCALGKLQEY